MPAETEIASVGVQGAHRLRRGAPPSPCGVKPMKLTTVLTFLLLLAVPGFGAVPEYRSMGQDIFDPKAGAEVLIAKSSPSSVMVASSVRRATWPSISSVAASNRSGHLRGALPGASALPQFRAPSCRDTPPRRRGGGGRTRFGGCPSHAGPDFPLARPSLRPSAQLVPSDCHRRSRRVGPRISRRATARRRERPA